MPPCPWMAARRRLPRCLSEAAMILHPHLLPARNDLRACRFGERAPGHSLLLAVSRPWHMVAGRSARADVPCCSS
jgi:hypothetical protein